MTRRHAHLRLFQKRLAALNPTFNAVVAVADPRVCVEDAETSADPDNPLRGLPIAVKEVIDVEGLPTTLCDPSLASGFASAIYTRPRSREQEAELVTLLRKKGL